MNIITKDIYDNLDLLPKNITGWNGESSLFHHLIKETGASHIIEVGSWLGQSAINMATYCKDNNLNTKITCVDTFLGALEFWNELKETPERNLLQKNGYPQVYYQFLSNVVHSGVQDYILPFPNTSLIAARYFLKNNIKAKLIYIDASHDYDDVLIDLKAYSQLLEPDGIIFGDDWTHWGDVRNAVNDFNREYGGELTIYEDNFWVIRK